MDENSAKPRNNVTEEKFSQGIGYSIISPHPHSSPPSPFHSSEPLLRRRGTAAEVPQAAVDPERGELLLHRILAQALVQNAEIHLIERLVLVEAGEDNGLGAAHGVPVHLKALRTDFLHHALHRRIDGGDGAVIGL